MLKNRIFFGLFICILAASPLYAANISFLVMETGRSPEGLSKQYPILWENILLDIFFEAGHIVSNSRMLELDEKPAGGFPDEAERDFENARDGGMDYFIITIVDYSQNGVSIRLFATNSTKMIHEERYVIKTLRPIKEEQEYMRAAIRSIAVYIN